MDAVVCARNEEDTIGEVCLKLKESGIDNVIVVNDGSTDNTEWIARQSGAMIVKGPECGKGAAMKEGLKYVTTERVLFFDADVKITNVQLLAHILELNPSGQVAIIREGTLLTKSPPITGERHLRTLQALAIPMKEWKAELAIDSYMGAKNLYNIHVKGGVIHGYMGMTPRELFYLSMAGIEYSYGLVRYPETVTLLGNKEK